MSGIPRGTQLTTHHSLLAGSATLPRPRGRRRLYNDDGGETGGAPVHVEEGPEGQTGMRLKSRGIQHSAQIIPQGQQGEEGDDLLHHRPKLPGSSLVGSNGL